MATKFNSVFFEVGYITMRRSLAYQIFNSPSSSTKCAVWGSALIASRGIRKRNALLPQLNGLTSTGAMQLRATECTPSAPMTASPCIVSPFSRVTVADFSSTDLTLLEVSSSTGRPRPLGEIAVSFSSRCRCARWARCHGCCHIPLVGLISIIFLRLSG